MDVFLMVKRKTLTMFLDAKETSSVLEVKRMIEGITKKQPDDQLLCIGKEEDRILEDSKRLEDYGLNRQSAQAQSPYLLCLRYRKDDGEFEALDIAELSAPRELPAPMKQHQDSAAAKQ